MKAKLSNFRSYIDPIYDDETGKRIYRDDQCYYDNYDETYCWIENAPTVDDMNGWENVYLDLAKMAKKRYNRYKDVPDCYDDEDEFIVNTLIYVDFVSPSKCVANFHDPIRDMEWDDLEAFANKIYGRLQLAGLNVKQIKAKVL